jgi:hypothetical protein
MVRALDGGDGKCSSIHGTTSPLLTAPQPGVRAPDREADPVEASRLAGDSVAARLGGRLNPERGRLNPERGRRKSAASPPGAAVSLGSVEGPARAGGAVHHIAVKLFGRFANNLDRPQEIGR